MPGERLAPVWGAGRGRRSPEPGWAEPRADCKRCFTARARGRAVSGSNRYFSGLSPCTPGRRAGPAMGRRARQATSLEIVLANAHDTLAAVPAAPHLATASPRGPTPPPAPPPPPTAPPPP